MTFPVAARVAALAVTAAVAVGVATDAHAEREGWPESFTVGTGSQGRKPSRLIDVRRLKKLSCNRSPSVAFGET